MAIAFKSSGSGVATETSGAALSPACPATVDANDILIAHVFWEGTTTAPSTPSNWTLLSGPHVIETTIARHWVFGKLATGTEDGAAVAFGNPAVTTQRGARVYSFSGYSSGTTITSLVRGFQHNSNANDPTAPSVTTTVAGALAVLLVGQNDNNTLASFTGESGGDYTEAVAEFTANLTPGLAMGLQTAAMANPGTITGGSDNTTNDPVGVIGFEIVPSPFLEADGSASGTGTVSGIPIPIAGTVGSASGTSTADAASDIALHRTTVRITQLSPHGDTKQRYADFTRSASTGIIETDGSASGTGTATGVGAAIWNVAASASGTSTVSGVGINLFNGVASSSATSTVSSDAVAIWDSLFSASGTATVEAVSTPIAGSVAASSGAATPASAGVAIWNVEAQAAGICEALAISDSPFGEGVGSAEGIATVSGVGAYFFVGEGSASGTSTVTGIGADFFAGVGASAGVGEALGVGENANAAAGASTIHNSYRRRGRR